MKTTYVYAVHYNRPDFIALQRWCLDKFLKGPFKYIVINNARVEKKGDLEVWAKIQMNAHAFADGCIKTHSDTPFSLCGKHHADALNQAWEHAGKSKPAYSYDLWLDGDVFLLDYFSMEKEFAWQDSPNRNVIATGVPQHRKGYNYISPTVVAIDQEWFISGFLLNWEGKEVEPGVHLDTGGGWWGWCKGPNTENDRVRPIKNTWHIKAENNNLHTLPKEVMSTYKEGWDFELYDDRWLHYCRSSAWDWSGEDYHKEKTEWLSAFVEKRLAGEIEMAKTGFDIGVNQWLGWV